MSPSGFIMHAIIKYVMLTSIFSANSFADIHESVADCRESSVTLGETRNIIIYYFIILYLVILNIYLFSFI